MPTPIPQLSDQALLAAIRQLRTPAYQNLSFIHTNYLEELILEARTRLLTIDSTH